MSLYQSMQALLEHNLQQGQLRQIISKKQSGPYIYVDGKKYVNLSSNDYLGLAQDESLNEEFIEKYHKSLRLSSSGSPLLTGAHESYAIATEAFEKLFNKKILFFNSGFAANSGIIATLGSSDKNLIIADKLSHASIINGMQNCKGKCLRFAHNDYEHLERLLEANAPLYENVIIVTEAIFSMDGDSCNLEKLVELKKAYKNVYLYVDEAHSFCLYNHNGAGWCAAHQLLDEIDFIVLTFGKGLGSQGAGVLCNQIAKDYFINTTRELIFSTALSPFVFAHNAFMLEKMQQEDKRRQRLHQISSYLQQSLDEVNLENLSSSQIIPLLTFENDKALDACNFFKEKGFYAMPIRHPTVPKGRARLRLSISAALEDNMVEKLKDTIKQFFNK